MPADLQKQVLLFTTGSDRIPVGGVSEMVFKITRVDNVNMSVVPFCFTPRRDVAMQCWARRTDPPNVAQAAPYETKPV